MSVSDLIKSIDESSEPGRFSPGAVAGCSALSFVTGKLDEALRSWDVDRSGAKSRVTVAAAMLRDYAGNGVDGTPRPPSGGTGGGTLAPWQARRVRAFIDASLDARIRLSDCAGEVGLSDGYFASAFKATFGTTVCSYIRYQRIERAKQRMLTSKEPLSQIALDCGFADQAHFCRVFRATVGTNPNSWRRNTLP